MSTSSTLNALQRGSLDMCMSDILNPPEREAPRRGILCASYNHNQRTGKIVPMHTTNWRQRQVSTHICLVCCTAAVLFTHKEWQDFLYVSIIEQIEDHWMQ